MFAHHVVISTWIFSIFSFEKKKKTFIVVKTSAYFSSILPSMIAVLKYVEACLYVCLLCLLVQFCRTNGEKENIDF